ncbi:packaged DNA stabilization protein [Serratia entomophila]|uniref:packaged DNA stabilization protein n=1 Tax=Serratia entomophila TaxID=42906 RepID=UPI002179EC32|nr:packaged DNA stabilization protein [Serratia entomophila]CAI0690491.1 Phage stabilisation protein [Serratia entomophila]CAI0802042.1 Phage stabilisation protein [Serratia entomophila]CAI0872454.1 Phage stabilisation protein [Serratia entomophila]CAI0882310.1 Phage stabilisation protein [Serratia entomophila]CAI0889381.1 Phage stabilisation protein [Serratia entomophila]
MPIQQLPLAKGLGKDYRNADYVDLLPVNLLATPKDVLGAAGYMRSYPGVVKQRDVAGISRGAQTNTVQNIAYRVAGGKLYKGAEIRGDVAGGSRISMAHSATSQAVAAEGVLTLYRYDGTNKTLQNWPERIVEQEGYTRTVKEWAHVDGNEDFIHFTAVDIDGETTITITPKTASGATGAPITIPEFMWNIFQSQTPPAVGTPYLTDFVVTGKKSDGAMIKITYFFHHNQAPETPVENLVDVTTFKAVQVVPEVATEYAQYDIGYVRDVCRNRGRYIWVKDGTNTFGVTDLEDESHPDQFRPFYSAESQPDGVLGIAAWRDFVVAFGSTSIEYFSLTGAPDATSPIYVAQPSLMVNKGIAGTYCKCPFGDSFAILSHPAGGAPSIYIINSGQASPIATSTVERLLREYTADELATAVLESVRFDAHELLIVHLPRNVLCFDASSTDNGPQWAALNTGSAPHGGVDYLFEGNVLTAGDKNAGRVGELRFNTAEQYGQSMEHILFTPMFKADNARVFDFVLEAATGVAQHAEQLFLSATTDGVIYGREQLIPWAAPFVYDHRVLWKRIGRVRKNIGFRIRIVTRSPITLSGASIRVE